MGLRKHLILFCFLFCSAGAAKAEERADAPAANRTLSPYFFVEGEPEGVEEFPLESTHVSANVSGVIADVRVVQSYRNDGVVPIHARYVFPASTRAAVHGLSIEVGKQRVVAKIKERAAANAEFEKAAAQGKTASLLEEQRPNVFTMAVANIMPGDHVKVELRYSELLVPNEGVYQFVYPTVVGPRYSHAAAKDAPADDRFVAQAYTHAGDPPPTSFAIEANLSAGMPIAELKSSSHPIKVDWRERSVAHVALADQKHFYGDRDFVLEYRLSGSALQTGLLLSEGSDENHFLLMVQPPARVSPAEIPPREYIFVLDVSGSMEGFPLDTAKRLLDELVRRLRPSDSFNLVLFAGDARVLAPRSLAANGDNIARALALISGERGRGGTELEAALRTAVGLPRTPRVSRSLVVITDGYISEERGAFQLIADNLDTTNLFAFGIGSSVNRYLIEGLAHVGHGEPFVVTSPTEAEAVAIRFRKYIEAPVLTQVEIRLHGFDAYDLEPARQPDLFAERPIVVIGKWRGEKLGSIEVVGQSGTGAFSQTLALSAASVRPEHAALPQLWARTRIARLSDMNVDPSDEAAQHEVRELGLRYALLTKYTSFIAVIEQIRNRGGDAEPIDQPLPLPLGVSELAVGEGYASGAEPELVWLLGPLFVVLGASVYKRRAWSRA